MALFKTKQTFHFEFEEIDNVNTTLIESFEELCDWVESENKRLANSEGKGSVLVLKKGDRDEKVYSEVHIHFPFENDTEVEVKLKEKNIDVLNIPEFFKQLKEKIDNYYIEKVDE